MDHLKTKVVKIPLKLNAVIYARPIKEAMFPLDVVSCNFNKIWIFGVFSVSTTKNSSWFKSKHSQTVYKKANKGDLSG